MGRKAVIAVISICYRNGDLFAELRANRPGAERGEGPPHALQRSGRIRNRLEHVRDHAEGALDLFQRCPGPGGGRGFVNKVHTCHKESPSLLLGGE
jgi:hypothetical protein